MFDFDGVIVPTFEMNFEIARALWPNITQDSYREMFMGNIYDSVLSRVAGYTEEERKKNHDVSNEEYFKMYVPRLMETKPMPEMVQQIRELHKKYKMAIVSSTVTGPLKEYLIMHDIAKHFDYIFGMDVHTNKTVKINMLFEKYGVTHNDCLFITDTVGDMKEAAKASLESIGVTWGFHTRELLNCENPFLVIDSPSELSPAIEKYFEKR